MGRPALAIEDKVLMVEDRGFVADATNLLTGEPGIWDESEPFLPAAP